MADAEGKIGCLEGCGLCCKGLGLFLRLYWRALIVVLWPLLMLPVIFANGNTPPWRCAYVVLVMAMYWVTEAIPVAVTSLIPIMAFPFMSILDTEVASMAYFKDTNVMYVAGLIIAIAIEYSRLHTRLALRVMLLVGTSHRRLTLGLTLVTMFVSMWVSNTAATAMMAPIVRAVLEQQEAQGLVRMYRPSDTPKAAGEEEEEPRPSRTTICYFLMTAYAATTGGIGCIVGTGTNITFRGIFEQSYPSAPEINFGQWILYNVPPMLIMTLLNWVAMSWMYLGLWRMGGMDAELRAQKEGTAEERARVEQVTRGVIAEKQQELGGITWHETAVGMCFLLAVGLWFMRKPDFIPGWGAAVTDLKLKDSSAGILVCVLLFVIPARLECWNAFRRDPARRPTEPSSGLVTWRVVQQKMPWGLMFLIGGGFAVAAAGKESGMSNMIGNSLRGLRALPQFLVIITVCFIATNMTEFSSNVAIANILLPVLSELANSIEMNPLFLMYPTAICCSFSFMMPVGTPGNALVAGLANIRTQDMMVSGILPTIITLVVTVGSFLSYGRVIYDLEDFPDWAKNATAKP